MEPVRDFAELRVYRNAFAGASEIFRATKRFPAEERYSLTDQIRCSSRSVCANIAEAWQKRRYPASFVSKLCDADGEAAETLFWLAAALDCGYIDREIHATLHGRYKHIGAQLGRMMADPDRWCRSSGNDTATVHSPPSTVHRQSEE
jgi:four helix bundle protein